MRRHVSASDVVQYRGMNGDEDADRASRYVCFMPRLIRTHHAGRERLTLHVNGASVTIELTVRGLEIDATTMERLLHAPMALLAAREVA
jgi:hypothetical protein